jgi:outer membrane protein TolC
VVGRDYSRLLSTWGWGVQLSVPAFDGFRREGRIAEQAVAVRDAALRARELREQVTTDVRTAQLDLAAAAAQVEAARQRQRLAEQEVAQARDRFAGGIASNAEVVTAALGLTGARTALVEALAQWQVARVAVARATGRVTRLR